MRERERERDNKRERKKEIEKFLKSQLATKATVENEHTAARTIYFYE